MRNRLGVCEQYSAESGYYEIALSVLKCSDTKSPPQRGLGTSTTGSSLRFYVNLYRSSTARPLFLHISPELVQRV